MVQIALLNLLMFFKIVIWICQPGESEVPVANCGESYFDSHPKSNWTLKDFVTYMREYKEKGYPSTMPCLYLKVKHHLLLIF